MNAAILSFPTPLERDEAEFDRNGTSNYVRAVEESAALGWAVAEGRDRLSLARRIGALAAQMDHLARYRPECLGDMVPLANGCLIELRLVPDVLRLMLGRAAND